MCKSQYLWGSLEFPCVHVAPCHLFDKSTTKTPFFSSSKTQIYRENTLRRTPVATATPQFIEIARESSYKPHSAINHYRPHSNCNLTMLLARESSCGGLNTKLFLPTLLFSLEPKRNPFRKYDFQFSSTNEQQNLQRLQPTILLVGNQAIDLSIRLHEKRKTQSSHLHHFRWRTQTMRQTSPPLCL